MIPKETIDTILAKADIAEVIGDFISLKKSGKSLYGKCPNCGKEGKNKGIIVTPSKRIYKCFSCEFTGNSPVTFLMSQNYSYPDALKYLADKYNIVIHENEPAKGPQKKSSIKEISFKDKQLESSGLNQDLLSIKAEVFVDEKTTRMVDVYESGTLDQYGKVVSGDDMIIWYYDLDGRQVMYEKPKTSKQVPLFRIRWQIPANHPDKDGHPIKYQSPKGSGSHLYIPQIIRRIYQEKRIIKRLYIQEGEKKADKACLHGLPSVGIMGIHNLANTGSMPHEFQRIINTCQVKEVVFVLDSDWDKLSNIKSGERIDIRPRSFFKAVKNYKDYFYAFNNSGIYLEIYFAWIRENEKKDKGIDDLLVNTLRGNEKELYDDFDYATTDSQGNGKHIQLKKITTYTDYQLQELWHIESTQSFLKKYKEDLINIPLFKVKELTWRYNGDNDEFEPAQPLLPDEQYWERIEWWDSNGKPRFKLQFDYVNVYNFLRNRGFGRIRMANNEYSLVRIENQIISTVKSSDIKDFIMQFTEDIASKDIRNFLYRGGRQYLGPDNLSNVYIFNPAFEIYDKDFQMLYFRNKYWKITSESISEKPLAQLEFSIWADKIKDFDATLINDPMLDVELITAKSIEALSENNRERFRQFIGLYSVDITAKGIDCHFLQFLLKTSEFNWSKYQDADTRQPLGGDERSEEDMFETNQHFLSKLTAIGYLLHSYIDKSREKAVVAMDGKMSEVGDSHGRSGKSLLGFAIGHVIPQVYVGSKNKKLTDDPFLFEGVTEKTKNVFFDDVRANIDIEHFFTHITGPFQIRPLGEKRYTLPEFDKPKLYFTTNHALNGFGPSFFDRLFMIAFSDYFNDTYKPIDEFGKNFFDEWDNYQYNLFYNLMARCIQLFLKFGLITPPSKRLELRRYRQFMGEDFFSWASEYFSYDENERSLNMNTRIPRKELWDDFMEKYPLQKRYVTPTNFKKKLRAYADFNSFEFNPKQGGRDDKSGGLEYITIADERYEG